RQNHAAKTMPTDPYQDRDITPGTRQYTECDCFSLKRNYWRNCALLGRKEFPVADVTQHYESLSVSTGDWAVGVGGRGRRPDEAGHEVMEVGGAAEGLADGAAGQHVLVGLVPAQLPLLPARRERRDGRLGQRPPGPLG